jgi:sigma-54 dependent transcriptional regulator, acetoin dehydrogenase operon transcriptional activator AcoR
MDEVVPAGDAARIPKPVEDARLARSRVRFLTHESFAHNEVRDAILASWWRSQQSQVPADRIEAPYFRDLDMDSPLIHSTEPVLRRLADQLDGQPISLILTDQSGVVLTQRTGDRDLQRHLDNVHLVPGFSYGEQFVGTNGIGTALEGGGPMHVFGHEHYAENLETLACAGVPLRHPISGRTIGAIDLTCWRKDAGKLLVALAKSTAEQIRQALLTTSSIRELELFQCYLQACQHTSGAVIALNNDLVMMNDHARQTLDPDDQSALLARAAQLLAEAGRSTTFLDLPSGMRAQLHCRRVYSRDGKLSGGVVHVKPIQPDLANAVPRAAAPILPRGLVGSTPLWLRCCQEVAACCAGGQWLALAGEAGVGKYAMASHLYQHCHPDHRLRVLDASHTANLPEAVRRELVTEQADALIIRHVERLDSGAARSVADTLRDVPERAGGPRPWIAVTLVTSPEDDDDGTSPTDLLSLLARTVHVPPLRYRPEDLRELVPFFLDDLSQHGRLSCSPAAMQLLTRSTWAGNITQLRNVLRYVTQHRRRSGAIQPADMPADFHTVTRRPLTQLEAMERDAIVQNLKDTQGNKVQAAKLLGISRATIYRKIHDYGIVT